MKKLILVFLLVLIPIAVQGAIATAGPQVTDSTGDCVSEGISVADTPNMTSPAEGIEYLPGEDPANVPAGAENGGEPDGEPSENTTPVALPGLQTDEIGTEAVLGYTISPSELPLLITDDYVAQHGRVFLLGGDKTFTSTDAQGIFILASDVILDGQNHILTGKMPNSDPYPTGVLVYGDNVTVKNIEVNGWYDGICFGNTNYGRIESVYSHHNKMGIDLHQATNAVVTYNRCNSNTDSGIFVYTSSSNNEISHNVANGNTLIGINVHTSSSYNLLFNNTANDNLDTGILIYVNSINNTLDQNTALRNTNNGIDVWTNNNQVINNYCANNAGGIYLDGASYNLVSGNTLINNRDGGFITAYYSGKATQYNTIENNIITGTIGSGSSSQNIGMIMYTSSNYNTIRGNNISDNNGGILLHDSRSNKIYNNYIRNRVWNVLFERTNTGNTWNIASSAGPNIVGGPYIGGNYWATPSGTGFSEITPDNNLDGFCDSTYQIMSGTPPGTATGQYDNLPLHTYAPVSDRIGVYRNGEWYLDINRNFGWDGTGTDWYRIFGIPGDRPVTGDWNSDGTDEIGVFRDGIWYFDMNRNYAWDSGDVAYSFGIPGDRPVTGDWNNDGRDKIGIFRSSTGEWYLDVNRNFAWDGTGTDWYRIFGIPGDQPVTGDWNVDGRDEIAVYRTGIWYLDMNRNYAWDSGDAAYLFGMSGDVPIAADWNSDGKDEFGLFRNGEWYLDMNRNFAWDGTGTDWYRIFGMTGDLPVVGPWK